MEDNNRFLGRKRETKKDDEDDKEEEKKLFISKGIYSYYLFFQRIQEEINPMEVYLVSKSWIQKEIVKKYFNIIESAVSRNIEEKEIIYGIKNMLSMEDLVPMKKSMINTIENILYYNNYSYMNKETLDNFIKGFNLNNIDVFKNVILHKNRNISIIELSKDNIKIIDIIYTSSLNKKKTSRYLIEFPKGYPYDELIDKILNDGISYVESYNRNEIETIIKIRVAGIFYYYKLKVKETRFNEELKLMNEKIYNILEKHFNNHYYLKAFTYLYCFQNLLNTLDTNNYTEEENDYKVYLIDKNWINNYKKMYNYEKAKIFLETNIHLLLNNKIGNINTFNEKFMNEIYTKINAKEVIEPIKFCRKIKINQNDINISYFSEFEFIDNKTFVCLERLYEVNSEFPEIKRKIHLLEDNMVIINHNYKNENVPSFQIAKITKNKNWENYLVTSKFNIDELKNMFIKNNFEFCMYMFGILNKNFAKLKIIHKNIYKGDIYNINNINPLLYIPNTFQLPKNNIINNINPLLPIQNSFQLQRNNNINYINNFNPLTYTPNTFQFQNNYNNQNSYNNVINSSNIFNNMNNPINLNLSYSTFYKNENKNKKKIIMDKPSLIGLENIGGTCYMNASLQCMSNVIELSRFFLKKDLWLINNNKKELSPAYQEVVYNLWPQEDNTFNLIKIKSYAPYNFKNIISKMNPLFQEGVQSIDPKGFVEFLLTEMHSELNIIKKSSNIQITNKENDNACSIYNYAEAFNKFSSYFMENYNSVISNIFFGMECSTTKCLSCGVSTYKVQCFNMLIFHLEKVRVFKKYDENQYLSIRDCLECHRNPYDLKGENQIYCNNCHLNSNAQNSSFLVYGPNVLIINLNRGKGIQYKVKINYELDLDISDFVCNDKSPKKYELIGVVMYYGESDDNRDFIAYCKCKLDNIWYKYNDSIVTKADINELYTAGIAYILFYHKI